MESSIIRVPGPSSNPPRAERVFPPGFFEGHHLSNSGAYFQSREDCSCTSVSEDEEDEPPVMSSKSSHKQKTSPPRSSSPFPTQKAKSPKKKCQLNQFVHHHLHRRHYPEYFGSHHSSPRELYGGSRHPYTSSGAHRMYSSSYSSVGHHHPGGSHQYVQNESRLPGPSHPPPSTSAHSVPHYLENIILNSHSMNKPQHDAELMKKLSKCIIIPENPKDPAAFTVTPGFTGTPKPPWCSSKPVQKIVGTFVILMSLGIIAAVLYVNWSSNTFRPMMK